MCEVNPALISWNGARLEDDEPTADGAAAGDGAGPGAGEADPESPLSRKAQESGTTMKT